MTYVEEIYPSPRFMGGKMASNRYGMMCGIPMQKSWTELFQLEVMLNRGGYKRVVELGTGTGGTTLLLGMHGFMKEMLIYSFDIGSDKIEQRMTEEVRNMLSRLYVMYRELDVFSNVPCIADIITNDGRTLVYNDCGGAKDQGKVKAFEVFGKYLKKNDVMLVHDYDTNEFTKEDAKRLCGELGYKPYDALWMEQFDAKHGAFIKI